MIPAVVILAGGEGSRIGGGKPLRLLAGRRLIDRAIDRARGWSVEVAIAVRDPEQVGDVDVPILVDTPGLEGPLAGLASALRGGEDIVLTIPCDMPFLPDDLPARLLAALGHREAALPASGGHVHPVCGMWRAGVQTALDDYAASGRRSLIGFAEEVGFATVGWADDPFFNVNDEAGFAEAERRLAGAGD